MNENEDMDAIFAAALSKPNELLIELDTRKYVKKKSKDDPVYLIQKLPILEVIKKEAVQYYNKYVDPLDISEKDVNACVFWSVYYATKKLNVPVSLETVARLAGLGLEKYTPEVKAKPLDFNVKLSHKKITKVTSYFHITFHNTEASIQNIQEHPFTVFDFLEQIVYENEEYLPHLNFINEFTEGLVEDEFWADQNPVILAYAILIFLSHLEKSPTYQLKILIPVYYSKNIVTGLLNKLRHYVLDI